APDPTDQELDSARRLLCGLAGRPVPGEDGLYRGFRDEYHDLSVGPCAVEDVAREVGCSLIVEVWTSDVDGFDCSYGEWVTLLRGDVVGASVGDVSVPESASLLTPDEIAECVRSARDDTPITVGDGQRVERSSGG